MPFENYSQYKVNILILIFRGFFHIPYLPIRRVEESTDVIVTFASPLLCSIFELCYLFWRSLLNVKVWKQEKNFRIEFKIGKFKDLRETFVYFIPIWLYKLMWLYQLIWFRPVVCSIRFLSFDQWETNIQV